MEILAATLASDLQTDGCPWSNPTGFRHVSSFGIFQTLERQTSSLLSFTAAQKETGWVEELFWRVLACSQVEGLPLGPS